MIHIFDWTSMEGEQRGLAGGEWGASVLNIHKRNVVNNECKHEVRSSTTSTK